MFQHYALSSDALTCALLTFVPNIHKLQLPGAFDTCSVLLISKEILKCGLLKCLLHHPVKFNVIIISSISIVIIIISFMIITSVITITFIIIIIIIIIRCCVYLSPAVLWRLSGFFPRSCSLDTPNLPTKFIPTKIRRLKLSRNIRTQKITLVIRIQTIDRIRSMFPRVFK